MMDSGDFFRSDYHGSMFHPRSYETTMYGNRCMSPTTPTKRKFSNINDEDCDAFLDSGYFSHSSPISRSQSSPLSHSRSSPISHSCSSPISHCCSSPISHSRSSPISHSKVCDGNVHHDVLCDSGRRERRRQSGGCCREEEVYCSPRRHREWSAHRYQHQENQMSLQSIHETTPVKKTICSPRRCFTDSKDFGNMYRGQIHSPGRPHTCVKSRKMLHFHDSFSDYYQDPQQYRSTSRRNLHDELDIVKSDWTRTPQSFTSDINNHGHSRYPCATPLHTAGYHHDNSCSRTPTKRSTPDISPARNLTASAKPKCCCSDLQNGLLKLAASAFSNIRRKAASPESFVQFKTELDLTNKFIEQTLEVLKQIKDVCGH